MALVDYETDGPLAVLTLSNAPASTYSYELNRELEVGLIERACRTGAEVGLERELRQRLFTSEDAAGGIAAFNEKRSPTFKGA